MATTSISNIGRSQTVSDIKPTITAAAIPTHSSLISNIGLIITAATSILPFMVSITSIGIQGYSPSNPPGIGIQLIGLSNYIL